MRFYPNQFVSFFLQIYVPYMQQTHIEEQYFQHVATSLKYNKSRVVLNASQDFFYRIQFIHSNFVHCAEAVYCMMLDTVVKF